MKETQRIDGILFASMLRAGCANLRAHVQEINELNVFPIPDGDTGDNMLLTLAAGMDAAGNGAEHLSVTARRAADAMLLGARGNSGVILSQIFAGIADGLSGMESADTAAICRALQEGVKHAYSAVLEPAEGTMLTVLRCAVERVCAHADDSSETLLCDYLTEARRALQTTPELLPVLKRAGVVDSGGAGLVCIAEGMQCVFDGTALPDVLPKAAVPDQPLDYDAFTEDSKLEFGYCTELLLRLQRSKTDVEAFETTTLTDELKEIGNSVAAVKTGSIVKLHIHTMTPDLVLAAGRRYGEFLKVKIENMALQHNEMSRPSERKERKPFAIVAVASGEGIAQLFSERGADVVLDGGQSSNPSAEQFLAAFERANADTIFVLPNNGNIILTAQQAARLYRASDVRVIASHSVGEGYAALSMLSYDSADADRIERELTEAMDGVTTAAVSKAVRDTDMVRAGQYIGFVGSEIIVAAERREDAVRDLLAQLSARDYAICLLLCGRESDSAESANIKKEFQTRYPDREIYLVDGQQEIYDYIMILE